MQGRGGPIPGSRWIVTAPDAPLVPDDALVTERLLPDPAGLARASALLHAGQTVAFPTETVYGLGADATNGQAVAAIYQAKGRPSFNPLIVHVPDVATALSLIDLPLAGQRLASALWPGPLTLVAPVRATSGIADLVMAGLPTLAVRVPAHPLAQQVLSACGRPVAAPSANLSGKVSPTTAAHVLDGLDGRIGAVLDGGACAIGLESTILGFHDGVPVMLRQGGVPVEEITAISASLLTESQDTGITAPGQLASHYAPNARVRLNAQAPLANEVWLGFGPGPDGPTLSASGDLREAAANLFSQLRALDQSASGRTIAVAPIPEHGLGLAINDRLRRAAAPR